MTGILTRLNADLAALPAGASTSALFDAAAAVDRRAAWLERLWRFFEAKFAQRHDASPFRTVLLAADEVVWSCYSQVFHRARVLDLTVAPATPPPLAFVEARYSPEAFPSELVPPDLKGEVEASLLREHLNKMPVSVVRIPPSCAPAPWWLVLLGHEVGHHVQYDLLPGRQLVDGFRSAIHDAVEGATGSSDEADAWARWSRELFADMFSAFCMGPWAVRAMLELELTTAEAMDEPRDNYPPPSTRLGLLATVVDRATGSSQGSDRLAGLVEWDADSPALAAVLDTALGPLPGLGATLRSLCDVDGSGFAADIASWCETFSRREERIPVPSTRSARILLSAAFAAWDTIAASPPGHTLEAARSDLSTRATSAMLLGAPEGEREGDERSIDASLADDAVNAIWRETA